jgi:N6-L-threonylcarbamoyladenine synthase
VSTGKFGAPSQFINAIAVTIGPGLAPALEVGLAFAKKLARQWQKPLIAVNHMEGHLLSSLSLPNFRVDQAERRAPGAEAASGAIEHVACLLVEQKFPWIALLASGGHTELVLVKKIGSYQLLGQTLDDAAGEALDKLAKMLQLGYPGGPIIEELAKQGNPNSIPLPVPMQRSQDLNFSFSGLKTAAMYLIKKSRLSKQFTQDLSAAFQQAIAVSLTTKLKKAIRQYQPRAILLGGGVFSNLYLRRQVRLAAKPLPVYLPYSKKLFTDNAAMIGVAAYHHFLEKDFANPEKLDRQPNLNF